jgi:hypothetical protein
MVDQPRKSSQPELGRIEFCYPAPPGLPVPIKPRRGCPEVLQQIQSFDWNSISGGRNTDLIRTGAFWLHGFLAESHVIAQGVHTVEGSYWHGLTHRSEGDFSTAMYWFRRVGRHAIFPDLLHAVKSLRPTSPIQFEALNGLNAPSEWQPQWLVDLCEEAYRGHFDELELLQRMAVIEYDLLMGYCLGM